MHPYYPFFLSFYLVAFLFSCSTPVEDSISEVEKKEAPGNWFYQQRAYPHGTIDKTIYYNALKEKKASNQIMNRNMPEWQFEGPTNIVGRITDVEMHPSSMDVIYAGAASGGIFKSMDQGESWTPVFEDALSLAIGDIGIAPSDPNILYVGTGESNAGGGSIAYNGYGIYKSENAGASWQHLGLENIGSVGKLIIHPDDPDKVIVAAMGPLFENNAERGLFRTLDGGQNWEQVLFVSDSTGAIDLAMHPENPDIIYAATWERVRRFNLRQYGGPTSGVYRSIDGGASWAELTNGLPEYDNGRIGLATTPAAPDMVYALYTDSIGYYKNVFRSYDSGENWTAIDTNGVLLQSVGNISYAWWFGKVFVHPEDPESFFVHNLHAYRTINGGTNWANISFNDTTELHVDQHALYIHPQDPDFVVLGNDGGIYISRDGGDSWEAKDNLPIAQFYTCEVDFSEPERLYGGTQDNGTLRILTSTEDNWQRILGGDGMVVKVNPANNNIIYASLQRGILTISTNGGGSFSFAMNGINTSTERRNWKTPYVLSPDNPSVLYYGSQRLWRSQNGASLWEPISPDLTGNPPQLDPSNAYGTITAIAVSPVDSDIIYVGTDDGRVWNTTEGGGIFNWNDLSANLPDRWVTAVATHPVEPETAYVTFSGYRYGEYMGHVFQTIDGGASWTDVSIDLPEVPVNDIIIDPENPEWLYLATDVGVYYSLNEGNDWAELGSGLPNVVINDIVLHSPTRKLIAGTYGRSMYSILLEKALSTEAIEAAAIDLEVYPNPVRDLTTISFQLKESGHADIALFNMNGQLIQRVFSGRINSGNHNYALDMTAYPAGYYFCKIKIENQNIGRRIVKTD